jgi:hypothetical protein
MAITIRLDGIRDRENEKTHDVDYLISMWRYFERSERRGIGLFHAASFFSSLE